MSAAREDVLKAAMDLPEQDRLVIAAELMGSVAEGLPGMSVNDPGFADELDRRSNDGAEGIPWDQVKSELQSDLQQ